MGRRGHNVFYAVLFIAQALSFLEFFRAIALLVSNAYGVWHCRASPSIVSYYLQNWSDEQPDRALLHVAGGGQWNCRALCLPPYSSWPLWAQGNAGGS